MHLPLPAYSSSDVGTRRNGDHSHSGRHMFRLVDKRCAGGTREGSRPKTRARKGRRELGQRRGLTPIVMFI